MSHFMAEMKGHRGKVSRLGTEASGVETHAKGWDVGVAVDLRCGDDGEDYALISITGGSHDPKAGPVMMISPEDFKAILDGSARLVVDRCPTEEKT
jgi:hypothetical protein